jgi:hypothetical protein
MRQLLTAYCCSLSQALLAQTHKPRLLRLSKSSLFEKLTAALKAGQLFRLYRAHFKLKQVKRNRYELAIKGSVLKDH